MKEYIPFIVFAGIIAVFTIIFIVKGKDLAGEEETPEEKDSTEETENQEQEENNQ